MQWFNLLFLAAIIFVATKQVATKSDALKPLSKNSIPIALLIFVAVSIVMWWSFSRALDLDSRTLMLGGVCQVVLAFVTFIYVVVSIRGSRQN
jgi:membrane protease YdiL (CAAX protease family)